MVEYKWFYKGNGKVGGEGVFREVEGEERGKEKGKWCDISVFIRKMEKGDFLGRGRKVNLEEVGRRLKGNSRIELIW